MATFTLKRGDTAPALEIALSIAGEDPPVYWDVGTDKPDAENTREVKEVRFILRDNAQNIINSASNKPYTGIGREIPTPSIGGTVLAYSWNEGDTDIAGIYNAEFEVIYKDFAGGFGKKRTFPSTTGDSLIINIEADLNDTNT